MKFIIFIMVVIVCVSIIVSVVICLLFEKYAYKPLKNLLTGKSYYKFEHIPSYGDIPVRYGWYKTDDDALKSSDGSWGDFVSRIYPKNEKLKPKN